MASQDDAALSLETPPVRTVRLAIYFKAEVPINGAHVGSLFAGWRDDYPNVSQEAPRAPLQGTTGRDLGFIGGDEPWPLPFTEVESADAARSILFQGDRFGLWWGFDPDLGDSVTYPGYAALSEELGERFNEFRATVERESSGMLAVSSAECQYVNVMPDVPIDLYAHGMLTAWSSGYDAQQAFQDGTEFSRHYHVHDDANRPVWVSAQSLGAGAGMTLQITTRRQGEGLNAAEALDGAHHDLIETFVQSTSPLMRAEWGQR